MKLVIATGNPGKVRDFQHVFDAARMDVEALSIKEFGGMPDVDETEPDFKGNARLKADGAKSVVPDGDDLWVLSDDSGLAVDFLSGAPGVHSARYAGDNATDEDNRNKLLDELRDVPQENRGACFVCHLCLVSPEGEYFHFEGKCEGSIAFEASGSNGFGYDPLFVPKNGTATWGEQEHGAKNDESHRGNACRLMLDWFSARQ